MTLKLHHVFTGKGVRVFEINSDALIDDFTHGIVKISVSRLTG